VLEQSYVITALIGASTVEQLKAAAEATTVNLKADELKKLDDLSKSFLVRAFEIS
jgi:aryl-alcohol dehydrogenase-like predicted oxidoreductase